MKKIFLSLLIITCLFPCFSQTILESDVLNKVQASVFEVVTNKTEEGGIEYESELPFSRLPFSVRNDKYNPIGTAFLTDDGNFYSAAHVFNLYEDSIYNDYYIRDRNGNVYKVDKITRFSTNRDFISFTVKDFVPEEIAGLSIMNTFSLNSPVFSVGNALGDGIVIRNGNLTSQTYETENGEWKWLRFSAAASPGNSGGPLITPQGEVLGIITMKSENENLNYALPFGEINNVKEDTGFVYVPFYYSLPNITSESFPYTFKKEVELPMELSKVQNSLISEYKAFATEAVKEINKVYTYKGKSGLATLSGKAEILNTYYGSYMPFTYYFTDKKKWSLGSPETKNYPLEENGFVELGGMMGVYMAKISPPDFSNVEELITSPKIYMEYLFEACSFSRNVGGKSVLIKSIGEPKSSKAYTDYFGRIWQVNLWNIDFADSQVISYSMPLPDGIYVIFAIASNSEASAYENDIAFLSDFQSITYIGTLKQWQDYLTLPESLVAKSHDYRTNVKIQQDEDSTQITVGEFSYDILQSTFDINDSTSLAICTSLSEEEDKCVTTFRSMDIYSNKREQDYKYIHVSRFDSPLEGAQKNTIEKYIQKLDEVSPYNSEPYNYEQYTYLDKVIFPEGTTEENKKDSKYLYVTTYEMVGQNRNEEIVDFAKKIEEGLSFIKPSDEKATSMVQENTEITEEVKKEKSSSSKKFFNAFK